MLLTTGASATRSRRIARSSAARAWTGSSRSGATRSACPFSDGRVWFPWNTDDITSTAAANLQQTLLLWTALVLTGLAVAFAFRCGLFNIGGNGQYLSGAIAAVLIATELPKAVHLSGPLLIVVSILGAMLAGAALAGIAGLLKGTVGAHEVITTIMLNWIVVWVGSYLFNVGGPLQTIGRRRRRGSVLGRTSRRRRTCTPSGATRSCRACTSASSSRSPRSSSTRSC